MTLMDLFVWDPLNAERPDRPNVRADSLPEAATMFVERKWADMDHPETVDVLIESAMVDEPRQQYRYTVTASQDVSFSASPTEPDSVDVEDAVREIGRLPVSVEGGAAYVNKQSVIALLRRLGRQ
jgi:hypothetical protein